MPLVCSMANIGLHQWTENWQEKKKDVKVTKSGKNTACTYARRVLRVDRWILFCPLPHTSSSLFFGGLSFIFRSLKMIDWDPQVGHGPCWSPTPECTNHGYGPRQMPALAPWYRGRPYCCLVSSGCIQPRGLRGAACIFALLEGSWDRIHVRG